MKKSLVILGIIAALIAAAFISITNGLSAGQNVTLSGIDLSRVPDGDYTGDYEHGRWKNTVLVRVRGNRIEGVDIVDDVRAAWLTDCSAEIFRRVIDRQDTRVDAVSGATVTSKAYLKAIEAALEAYLKR